MIPYYVLEATGPRVFSLDDPATVLDTAELNGTGGTAFVPYYVTAFLRGRAGHGWSGLRRIALRLSHVEPVTVVMTPLRDRQLSGHAITRSLALGAVGILTFPANESGSVFQYRIDVTAYASVVTFSDAEAYVLAARASRR